MAHLLRWLPLMRYSKSSEGFVGIIYSIWVTLRCTHTHTCDTVILKQICDVYILQMEAP